MSNLLEDHEVPEMKKQPSVLQCFERISRNNLCSEADVATQQSTDLSEPSINDNKKITDGTASFHLQHCSVKLKPKSIQHFTENSDTDTNDSVQYAIGSRSCQTHQNVLNASQCISHPLDVTLADTQCCNINSFAHAVKNSMQKICAMEYQCPVCDQLISCDTLASFNKHIDDCLSGNSTENNVSSACSSLQVVKEIGCENIDVEISNSKLTPQSVGETSKEQLIKKDQTNVMKSIMGKDDLIKADSVCPICDKLVLAESLETFNEHVDFCLNRNLIQEMVQEENIRLTQKRLESLFILVHLRIKETFCC